MTNYNHPYHLVNFSPWPLFSSMSIMSLTISLVNYFHNCNYNLLKLSFIIIILSSFQWWRDIYRESTFQGNHSILVLKGLRWGMILFIISEIFFFTSFFWAFFHSSLSPNIEIGMKWPPNEIFPFNPFQIPLLNTIILITSGITVTWTHHSLLKNNYSQTTQSLILTVMLGMYFTLLQTYEYFESSFTIADSIYGSTFFMATGFHGLHVIIGTIFLSICLIRHMNFHFSKNHHFGFEAAAWYWHFVDIVWLLLFISIYWWGN